MTKALRDAGFDRELPTLWVWAGVLMYLPEPQARATVGELRALSAPGSRLYFDMILEEALARPRAYGFERVLKRIASFGEVMGTGFRSGRDHVGSWLFPQGFQLEQVFDDVDMAMVWSESTGMPPSAGVPWSQLCVARTRWGKAGAAAGCCAAKAPVIASPKGAAILCLRSRQQQTRTRQMAQRAQGDSGSSLTGFTRPLRRSASRNTYSIWAFKLRKSSSAHRCMASRIAVLMRRG
ncbi:MAG: class I SAM-dependent methyltransferase [Ahniella sp.]|nr:class I SAM-dependent methyltransferase [Ahniella sp.]